MITIIDYGVGNINAFYNIFKTLGVEVSIARNSNDILNSKKLILPGVGHFDYAMNKFNESGMVESVTDLVMSKSVPVLGICVGMQMLATYSEEGKLPGLNWINADVKKIDSSLLTQTTRLPHMGWNDILVDNNNPLFHNLKEAPRYYFLHSYYFNCKNNDDTIATSIYGNKFTCAVNHKNIYGVQFHPEKSHHFGIQLLKNFANL
jgi:glutamine amidotransferase